VETLLTPDRNPALDPAPEHAADPTVVEEEQLLARVRAHLATVRPSLPPPTQDYETDLLSLRDEIASARLEDVPALVQQMERLSGIAAMRADHVVEPVDPRSPYFGHLRLREEGRGERDVLIGKTTHVDGKAGVRIVDWRHAPVSQIYYRYEEGSDYEETFGEREVEGTVLVRRTVTIDDGELLRISAPQATYVRVEGGWKALGVEATELSGGQGSALRPEDMKGALGVGGSFAAREDRHLPEIAALLDPRQFDLISRPDSGIVVIQGGAGSGKTTIGIHRMAFLNFNARQRFSPDKMLIIVGSPALRAYIGEILPALGLRGVAVETFREWVSATRQRTFPWLEVPVEESTPSVVTRFKTHPAMLKMLDERADAYAEDPRARKDSHGVLHFWADLLTDVDRALAAFAREADPEFGPDQVRRAVRWCSDRCPAVLDADPGDRAERRAAEEPSDDEDGMGADAKAIGPDDRATLDPEDDALLVRAYQRIRGELRRGKQPLVYEHLFVDEAQDLAPIDLGVLLGVVAKHDVPHAPEPLPSVTLAGDTAQRLFMDSGFRDWRTLLGDLGLTGSVDIEPLRIAYRSTRQVLEVAREILGPLADPTPPIAPRSGAPVEHHHFPSQGAAVAFLADAIRPLMAREPRATLAILARHPEQADVYYDALRMAEIPRLSRVRHYEFNFRPGVEVTEIRQVKGLEYDYVVLIDVNASTYPTDAESRHLLHIGATRAAHQLWLVSSGPPSALIPARLR
jgi:DNA helicase-2/ATP-dependent DNA helicase PcrA